MTQNEGNTAIDYKIPAEKKLRLVQESLVTLIAEFGRAFGDKYGEEAWVIMEDILRKTGQQRAHNMKVNLNLDPDDASSLRRMIDFEDHIFGIKGKWTEISKDRAVKIEHECIMAKALTKCPEYCSRLMLALETGTLEGLGGTRKKSLALEKIIPEGADVCKVVLTVTD